MGTTGAQKQMILQASRLIRQGQALLREWRRCPRPGWGSTRVFTQWRIEGHNFVRLLGENSLHCERVFADAVERADDIEEMLGTLDALREILRRGLLVKIEELVFAEAFVGLLDQADYLFKSGYHVAAGVLGRAVLEEHLHKWCERAACMPKAKRPCLDDYRQALYANQMINRVAFGEIDAMAAIGNAAAHHKPTQSSALTAEDVARLLRDVRGFLSRHPLS